MIKYLTRAAFSSSLFFTVQSTSAEITCPPKLSYNQFAEIVKGAKNVKIGKSVLNFVGGPSGLAMLKENPNSKVDAGLVDEKVIGPKTQECLYKLATSKEKPIRIVATEAQVSDENRAAASHHANVAHAQGKLKPNASKAESSGIVVSK